MKKTKNKSIIYTLLTAIAVVLAVPVAGLPVAWAAALTAISAIATLSLKTFFPSGETVQWATFTLWVTNLGTFGIQCLTIFTSVVVIEPMILAIIHLSINMIVLVANNMQVNYQNEPPTYHDEDGSV